MAVSFVQSKSNVDATNHTNHVSGTLASTPTQNNLLVLVAMLVTPIANVTTPSGYSVAFQDDDDAGGYSISVFYKIAGASEPTSVTITTSTSVADNVAILEFSGVDTSSPLRTATGNDPSGLNTAVFAGSITPVTGELLVAAAAQGNPNNGGSEAVGSSYNIVETATLTRLSVAYIVAPNTSALNPQFTWTSSVARVAAHAAFNEASASVPHSFGGNVGASLPTTGAVSLGGYI